METEQLTPPEVDARLAEIQEEMDKWHRLWKEAKDPKRVAKPTPKIMQDRLQLAERHWEKFIAAGNKSLPYNALYEREPWERYFAVPAGHVHRRMDCPTCNRDGKYTQFVWLTADSGRTWQDMISEYGWNMCTVCFPAAPLDPLFLTAGRREQGKLEEAARRRLELEAKALAREAGIPRDAEGAPLQLSGYDAPKTLISAQRLLLGRLRDVFWYRLGTAARGDATQHPDEPAWLEDVAALLNAIARLTGEDPQELLEATRDRAKAQAEKAFAEANK